MKRETIDQRHPRRPSQKNQSEMGTEYRWKSKTDANAFG
jgi:hypothetical protein